MPIGPARMPFLRHLDELRKRVFLVIGVLTVLTIAAYFFTDYIMAFLLSPVRGSLAGELPAVFDPLEAMTLRFVLSFWTSIIVASPLIIWQVMAFLLPALKPKERKWFVPTFVAAVVLFIVGAVFAYLVILPASFEWLIAQAGTSMRTILRAESTLTVVEFFLLGFGVAFQTPIIVFYLVFFGVIKYKKLREGWRFVYVGITVAAAMITPDWSPVSMGALALAMIALYELSMLLCRVLLAKKIKAQNAPPDDEAEDLEAAQA
jgi:sec-independent protein translocase protein TatC